MNRVRCNTAIVLVLLLLLSACGGKDAEKWIKEGHVYKADPSLTETPEPVPETQLVEGRPIMRVIAGEEVEGPEEALARLTAAKENDLGLRTQVERLALREVPLIQVAALLSEMSGYNIAVTRRAAETPVNLYLQNLPLRQALEAVCRLNNLWYREDERIVTIMTVEEYGEEMVVRRNEKSRAYWLRYSNANDMAKILQAVMGSQIVFNDIGEEKIYGHVEEEKEAGKQVSLRDDAGGQQKDRLEARLGFSVEEVRHLLSLRSLEGTGLDAVEMSKAIAKNVPAVITVFKRNNAIIARSLDESVLVDIGRIIELMDTPTSQVLLEISILQLNLGDGFESFFQLNFPGAYDNAFPDNIYQHDSSGTFPPVAPDTGYWTRDQEGKDIFVNLDYAGRAITYATEVIGSTIGGSNGLASTTLNLLFGSERIQARLQLYEDENRIEVLATPYLMSANNSKVEFFVGNEVPLRDDVESETLFNQEGFITTTNFTVKINREELGTDIEVSSFINEDGTITMDLEAELSFPVYNITSIGVVNSVTGAVINFPLDGVDRSKLNSIVTTVSGQPIAIGGIIREELQQYEKKVPLLGDIPLLGFPFREIVDKRSKKETIILITPHVISHPSQTWRVGGDFLERRSSHPRMVREQENILDYPTGRKEE
jgi:type II secretory pathway component GspD/PulD (secretin)